MAKVDLIDIRKVYGVLGKGGFEAVKGISLTIHDGEFLVLVGPSGCGKSTTLRMVAGLEDITEGTISIGDQVVNNIAPKDRDIAMVFQNYALYPHMTVYKNMAFGLKLRKFSRDEIDRRVNDAAEILGIKDLLDRKPKALSGGQRQRVAVGRAIVRDPACFLFDEPLSNLDAKLRVETRAELKRLHHRLKTTTIYVTHDQEEAMTLGDRVVVMSEGEIQQVDAPLNIFHQPINRFVAAFVGMPPMNFIEGLIKTCDSGIIFQAPGDIEITLRADKAEPLTQLLNTEGAGDKEVVLGIRPEALKLESDSANPRNSLSATIGVTEPLGSMMDVFATTASGQSITARIKAVPIDSGTAATFAIDQDHIHIFGLGEYGANLTRETVESACV